MFGDPVHQMLIVFPLGLLAMATVFDVIRLATGSSALAIASYYMIAAGVISGLWWSWLCSRRAGSSGATIRLAQRCSCSCWLSPTPCWHSWDGAVGMMGKA